MENLTSEMESLQWRRDKVQDLSSKGHSQREIAKTLQVWSIEISTTCKKQYQKIH